MALKQAWRGSVEPIVASAATVILGLLCLLLAELRSTSGLGPVGALGIAGALLASLTFLPAVLLLFGRQVFWPFAPKLDHVHAEDVVGTKGLWGRVADLVGRHPRRTWVVTLVVLLAAAAFAPTFKASGSTIDETFLDDTDSITAQQVIGEHFPAGSATPVQIVVPEADAEAALAVVTKDPGVDSAYIGLVPPQPGQPAVPPKVVDGTVLIQATTKAASDSPEAEDTVQRLRSDLDAVSTDALVGGNAATNLDVHEASSRDLRVIVPTILLVIFVVLALLLRSIVAPLLLVAANVVSFAATIGISALVFQHVFGFHSSDPSIVLYGFVFLVALGIDYSIFLMTRVREESKVRGTRPGILDRPRRDRRGDHQRGHRSRGDVLGPGRAAAGVPRADRVHRRLRRAARHLRRALAARARGGLRHRPAGVVAAAPARRPGAGRAGLARTGLARTGLARPRAGAGPHLLTAAPAGRYQRHPDRLLAGGTARSRALPWHGPSGRRRRDLPGDDHRGGCHAVSPFVVLRTRRTVVARRGRAGGRGRTTGCRGWAPCGGATHR